jgi:hypothetical protein
MYLLLKNAGLKKFLTREMPSLSVSLILAEVFYKFGSFILECGAFLGTWYVISMFYNSLLTFKADKKNQIAEAESQ